MAIADTFEDALLKAVRGAEIGVNTLALPALEAIADDELQKRLRTATDQRLFELYEAIRRGAGVDELFDVTKIDRWFLNGLVNIANGRVGSGSAVYKMVDTCGGEFAAQTPYFYAIHGGGEDEALPFVEASEKPRVVVLGSGPIRIGQGIEFDYACVHCVKTLREMGYEAIVVNNNPETVSTDFDTGDRLYFEPLCLEDVLRVVETEKAIGVMVAFGGGTAIKLTRALAERGVAILGTSADSIDICEDRERFDALLEKLSIKRPRGLSVMTEPEALAAAESLGYPVLIRPSYVLGGQNMIVAFSPEDVREYMRIILRTEQKNPILIDKYLKGIEIEVDAICDGEDMLIPGIMEHIERTGIHSGDSIAIYPPLHIDDALAERILGITRALCDALEVRGLVNIQYVLYQGDIYVIEVNPRASRTVPYISKVTGVPMCELATRIALGQKLTELGRTSGIAPRPPYVAAKVPVFSFEKLADVDTLLGPEMKSTGEVLGIGKNLREALYKGLVAAGYTMKRQGGVLITVRDSDKPEIADIAEKFVKCGFSLYATAGTADALERKGLAVRRVGKIHESPENNTATLLESGLISYILSTSEKGRNPAADDVKIRRMACSLGIPCLTSPDTANALADSLLSGYSEINTELIDINHMRKERMRLSFTKMQSCGNDYIYINCFDTEINSPESLSILLSDRHYGVGGDGVVLILPSDVADAKMRTFNLDGSEGRMGGNAIRCVGKYLYDNGIVPKLSMKIETLSGVKELALSTTDGAVSTAMVDMGRAELAPEQVPVLLAGERIVAQSIEVGGAQYAITCVSMGNPHAVVFEENIDSLNLQEIGPLFEHHPLFPDRVNTEFVERIERNVLKMRVWERGNGETLACGTGACAAAVAAVLNGTCDADADIRVRLAGGELIVRYTKDAVYMTGDCIEVFDGMVRI
jgi:carbamoyl-phosphate synthase large subunit